jgi:hypothetical protein
VHLERWASGIRWGSADAIEEPQLPAALQQLASNISDTVRGCLCPILCLYWPGRAVIDSVSRVRGPARDAEESLSGRTLRRATIVEDLKRCPLSLRSWLAALSALLDRLGRAVAVALLLACRSPSYATSPLRPPWTRIACGSCACACSSWRRWNRRSIPAPCRCRTAAGRAQSTGRSGQWGRKPRGRRAAVGLLLETERRGTTGSGSRWWQCQSLGSRRGRLRMRRWEVCRPQDTSVAGDAACQDDA